MGEFSKRIMNKSIEDVTQFNILKENARLQGEYPMTVEKLKSEIQKVNSSLQYEYNGYFMGSAKTWMLAMVHCFDDWNEDKIFKYYIEEVKPWIF